MTVEELQAELNKALIEIEQLKFRLASLAAELDRTLEALKIAQGGL